MANDERAGKPKSEESDGTLVDQIQRYISEGKDKLLSLESRLRGDQNVKRFLNGAGRTKEKLQKVKHQAENYGSKAERYIKENPKKSVAIAAGVGLLAGALWSTLSGKKPAPPKKTGPVKLKPKHASSRL